MKNKDNVSKREKSAAVGLVVCFVAMIGIVGMVTFNQNKQEAKRKEQQLAKMEPKQKVEQEEKAESANTDTVLSEIEDKINSQEIVVTPKVPVAEPLQFSGADVLLWPLDGNVVLRYSMDKTIYFSTLDQYKYNPAIMIGGDVGEEVQSATVGEITSIETLVQTGTTITMNIGSGYELVYGQLTDVKVKVGDRVSKGEVIGVLNTPTKYYNVEGPNLYFQILKDKKPVNPMEYLEA